MQMFINTLVFADKYKMPISQFEIIKELIEHGYKNIEIRRDFISNIKKELPLISQLCKENNVVLYYSIPDTLYKNFKLDTKSINKYLEEANILGSKTIKLAVGTYSGYNNGDDLYFKQLLSSGIKLYVENDQTIENGKVEKIKQFLDDCKNHQNNVYATFDVGNWLWPGEEPEKCSEILKEYVDYVHFKDVKVEDGKYKATTLGNGIIDFKYFLQQFKNITIGLEYPCGKNPIETINEEIKKCIF